MEDTENTNETFLLETVPKDDSLLNVKESKEKESL
jgi:hypothetical protein